MNAFLSRFRTFAQTECRLLPDQPILVGVSGGPDSLCLLHALHGAGYPVIAAHFNHHLRADSTLDADFVAEVANARGVPFVGDAGDVAGFSRQAGLSIEEGARTLRYRFLFEQARRFRAQAVAVGHTAEDQVETVLMHFLRGAGLDGLKGMLPRTILPVWDADIPLVRPLLEIRRAEVEFYCRENGVQPRMDPTNLDTSIFRNQLRHELIPTLESYNARFREGITRMAKTLAADQKILQEVTDLAWQECLFRLAPTYLALSTAGFFRQTVGIQRRLLRMGVAFLRPGLRDVDFAAIERVLQFLGNLKDGVCELTGNLRVFVEGDRFWVAECEGDLPSDEWPQMPVNAPHWLDVPGDVTLAGGWKLIAERCPLPSPVGDSPDRAWLDAAALTLPLTVRPRRSGDRFQPLGMEGREVKLSDFLINAKVPRRARGAWPLVGSGEQIAWIPGLRAAEPFRVTETTREVICLSLVHNEAG